MISTRSTLPKIALCALLVFAATSLQAASPHPIQSDTPPRISPVAQTAQVVGTTGISVTYGRPAVKGRKVFGKLEPWGQVWRTGANDPTIISLSDDITVEGKRLASGTYALFTIPGKEEWSVIFNEDYQQWGAFSYSEEKDVLRVRVRPEKASHQELFLIDFPEVGEEEATLRLRWAKTAVSLKLRAPISEETLVKKARHTAQSGSVNHIWEWTSYLLSRDVTLPEMVAWTDRIAETYPGFYATNLKANVLAKMGRTRDAIVTGEKALALGAEELSTSQFLTQSQLDAFEETVEQWRGSSTAGSR